MQVFKTNIRGEEVFMDLDVTEQQMQQYRSGKGFVQDIFPNLKPCEREFLITGMTPKLWEELFGGCTWPCDPCPYNVRHLSEDEDEDEGDWHGRQLSADETH